MTDLINAAAEGNYARVDKCLLAGDNPDCTDDSGRTALHWAAQEGHVEIVQRLIAGDSTLDHKEDLGFTALNLAVGQGHTHVVRELLMADASANVKNPADGNGTPLHLACSWNRAEIAKLLVEMGHAEINSRDGEGNTPLKFAIDGDFRDLAAYLTQHGAVT